MEKLKKVARLARLRSLLRQVNFYHVVTVDGEKIKMPVVAGIHSGLNEGWLKGLTRVLRSRVDGAFVDVGANKGQTLAVIKAIDPKRPYLAVEPIPDCVFYLRRMISVNKFSNVQLCCTGAWKQPGILELKFPGMAGTSPAASFIENFHQKSGVESIFVPVTPLDAICAVHAITKVGFLKIDAEGSELEVLEGAKRVVCENRPVVLFEGLPTKQEKDKCARQRKVCELLLKWNFSVYRITRRGDDVPGLVPIGECGVSSEFGHHDYLAIPSEQHDQIMADNWR